MRALGLLGLLGAPGCIWIDQEDRDAWACERWLEQGPWYLDQDRDGAGSAEATRADCPSMELYVAEAGDCDDQDASRFPTNPELCQDGIDQDCDGVDPQRAAWYPDEDQDGWGDDAGMLSSCEAPEGSVDVGGDCDDQDADTRPDAADPVCGDGIDQNCDGEIECLVSGDVDLSGGWSAWGLARSFASGAPLGLAAGADLDQDGVADIAVGGEGVAWSLMVGADREAESTRVDPGFEAEDGAGAAVALVRGGGAAGALALGAPSWTGSTGTGEGSVALIWNGNDETLGWITAPEGVEQAGAALAAAGDTLAVATMTRVEEELPGYLWSATLLSGEALPGPDETLRLDRAVEDATVELDWSLTLKAPRLALGGGEEGLDLALALAPETPSEGTELIWFGGPLSGAIDRDQAALALLDTEGDLGAAVALLDLDGDGAQDLAAGSPSAGAVQLYAGPASEASDTPDWSFEADGAGAALARAGDVDGDGVDDLLVGAPEEDRVWLVLGGQRGAALEAAATITGPAGSELGHTLSGADVDEDGWSDLVMGSPGSSSVYVLWGGP